MEALYLLDHVSDPAIIIDENFCIVSANQSFCAFFGLRKQDVLGRKTCALFRELEFFYCNGACKSVISNQAADGARRDLLDELCPHFHNVYPVLDRQGIIQKVLFIFKNGLQRQHSSEVTEQRDTGNDIRDMMLSMIYHDLASPVQVIKACTDVIEMELQDYTEIKRKAMLDVLQTSKRNERRLYEMVHTIRMIPLLEEADVFQGEIVQPDEVVDTVCLDFRLLLRENVTFESYIPPNLPEIMIEPGLFAQVFFNLLDNAARYTRPGGCIVVSAQYEIGDTHVIFRVFDKGEIIPPEIQSRLFDKNLVADHKKGKAGIRRDHGFGLHFCQLVTEKFGGSIWVESKEGWGTQFSFTVPVARSPAQIAETDSNCRRMMQR